MITKQKKSLKVGKLVDTNHVNSVIRNYKKERWVQNSKHIGKEDSLSVWYSVEELEEYLAKVKDHGGDGIRMYFGVYGEDYKGDPLYAGRQTVVLVATKNKETENGDVRKDLYIGTETGTTILAWNAGTICPPYCSNDGTGTGYPFPGVGITIVDKGEDGIVIA